MFNLMKSVIAHDLIKKRICILLDGLGQFFKKVSRELFEISAFINLVKTGHLEIKLRPDDIFIVTYPRSGTTWMQMILYQLTSDGSMDFDHINQKIPWFERAIFFGLMDKDDFESLPSPRIFKSHLSCFWIPKGDARYIYVYRNGLDVALSYYHFYKSHLFFQGSFDDFFKKFIKGQVQYRSWFRHVKRWRDQAHLPNILLVKYEDMKLDLRGTLDRLISFLNIDVAEDRLPDIEKKCRFAFMKQHEHQFDHTQAMVWEKKRKNNAFIREGQIGKGEQAFNHKQLALFNKVYASYFKQSQ